MLNQTMLFEPAVEGGKQKIASVKIHLPCHRSPVSV